MRFDVRLEICCEDRIGIAQEVLKILVEHEIDLRKIEVSPSKQRMYVAFREVQFACLQKVMPQIRKINGIGDVKTIAFIPSEREHDELRTLLKALPDGVISIDTKACIVMANQSALSSLGSVRQDILGQPIQQFFSGFNFLEYLSSASTASAATKTADHESKNQGSSDDYIAIQPQTIQLKGAHESFVADILPIRVSDQEMTGSVIGAVVNIKSQRRLGQQVGAFRQPNQSVASQSSFEHIICKSRQMKSVIRALQKMARLGAPILLNGETGTGKELLARACHTSDRGDTMPFIVINCAAIPDEDVELELFGRMDTKRGVIQTYGLLEQASGGTLFLDEVSEMSANLQAKLVRFLHHQRFRRVGGGSEVVVDVKVIAATQKDLSQLVNQGIFREDLFYRLNVLTLTVPPLRDRKADIIPLALYFIYQFSVQMGQIIPSLEEQCEQMLQEYGWPGNVRQLENALYRAVTLQDGDKIGLQHLQLPIYTKVAVIGKEVPDSLEDAVKQYEAGILRELFPSFPSSRQLAKRLGLSHTAVANKLREYGISKRTINKLEK